ncbi:bifunctional tetrahydrofolate synthase/dihydrofolate synthase, partial [Erwinia amylovora]|nr:bifunctional tetrahydrofolate synthase/dihydrofolate synthase [Erwinia amylovora]
EGPRGASAEQLMTHLKAAQSVASVTAAWHHALMQAGQQDIVLVCGSFHTVAHVMETMASENGSGK